MNVQTLRFDEIFIDSDFNCRESIIVTSCFDLAKSISEKGLMQPVVVSTCDPEQVEKTGKKYRLIAGFRRCTAAKSLGWEEIPCSIVESVSLQEALAFNLTENIQRKQISYWEECKAIEKLHNCKMTREEIAVAINQPPGWVQRRQNVLKLPKEAQELVKLDILTPSHVSELFKFQKQDELLAEVTRIRNQYQMNPTAKIVIGKPMVAKRNAGLIKKARKPEDITDLIVYMRHVGVKQQLAYRVAAWAAGSITDYELLGDVKKELEADGLAFDMPPNGIPRDLTQIKGMG